MVTRSSRLTRRHVNRLIKSAEIAKRIAPEPTGPDGEITEGAKPPRVRQGESPKAFSLTSSVGPATFDERRSPLPSVTRVLAATTREIRETIQNLREETMKIRLLGALVGLVIGFALPIFAQQKETVDPQTIEQLIAFGKKFDETQNNNDAASLAAFFTEDAVFVTNTGPVYGGQAIERWFTDDFQEWARPRLVG